MAYNKILGSIHDHFGGLKRCFGLLTIKNLSLLHLNYVNFLTSFLCCVYDNIFKKKLFEIVNIMLLHMNVCEHSCHSFSIYEILLGSGKILCEICTSRLYSKGILVLIFQYAWDRSCGYIADNLQLSNYIWKLGNQRICILRTVL